MGVNIVGVSKYVCDSYHLPYKKISYVNLLADQLNEGLNLNQKKVLSGVIWLRPGDSNKVFTIVMKLSNCNLLNSVYILGDEYECDILSDMLKSSPVSDNFILNNIPRLSHSDFISALNKSTWFLSFFPKEGFGISAFEAAFLGCIILANEKSGGLKEWLPEENFNILRRIDQGLKIPDAAEIALLSKNNHLFAKEYMSNSV